MLNPKRSFSSSYFDMEVNSRPRVPSLLSASDSFALLKQPCFAKSESFSTRGLLKRDQGVAKFGEVTKYFENVSSNDNSISGIKVPLIPSFSTVAEQRNVTQSRQRHDNALDSELSSKKSKRAIANRLSAQRSRLRKLAYVEKLKGDVKAEEDKVSCLSPQVSFYHRHQMALKTENTHIKVIMGVLEKEKAMKEVEFQYLKQQVEALRIAFKGLLSN